MKIKDCILLTIEGAQEAERLELAESKNWTPLLIYIHVTRITIGAIIGFLVGISLIPALLVLLGR
jgi:hypothetical protein